MRITLAKLVSNLNPNLLKPVVGLAALAALASACGSSTSSNPGTGGTSGSSGGTAGATGTAGNGTGGTSTGGTTGSGGTTGNGGSAAGNTGSAGNGTAGSAGGNVGAGGNSTTGTGGGTAGAAGGNVGTGGNATGGTSQGGRGGGGAGTGGSGTGGRGGSSAGTGGGAGGAAGTGGSSAAACPSNAIFCANFEEANGPPMNNPVGTATIADPDEYGIAFGDTTGAFVLDTAGSFAGTKSFKVTSPGAFHYRMLGVTVPQTFWVRLHIKSDHAIGQDGHNAFFIAMTDPNYHNSSHSVEVSEQFSCIILNDHDTLYPTGTTCGANSALSANTWHCMEAMFDGATGDVQVYADGTQIINAAAWPNAKATFNTFEFGYANYHDPAASVWYDDVAIATTRPGCN